MAESKQQKVLTTLSKILEKRQALLDACNEEIAKLDTDKAKLVEYLMSTAELSEVPQIIKDADPFLAWSITEKTDASGIEAYRAIRETVQKSNSAAKDFETVHNEQKDKIGNWLLDSLNKSGAKSINCGTVGKAYKKRKVQASPADWDNFLRWVAENDAFDAVQKRVNGSFVDNYFNEKIKEDEAKAKIENRDPHGEYPPFLNVSVEWEVTVTK